MTESDHGMERIQWGYSDGYRQALLDVAEALDGVFDGMAHFHKRMTQKYAAKFMKCMIDNRMNLRERRDHGFIRYNGQKDDFEYFDRDNIWRVPLKLLTEIAAEEVNRRDEIG